MGRVTRTTRKAQRGGAISDYWYFGMCKALISNLGLAPPPGTLKSHRKCLEFLAAKIRMDPEDMYNLMTPDEYVVRSGEPRLEMKFLGMIRRGYMLGYDKEHRAEQKRVPLPGKAPTAESLAAEANAARRREETAAAARREAKWNTNTEPESDEEREAWMKERVAELEAGNNLYLSEEVEDHSSAMPRLVRAARRGAKTRNARSAARHLEARRAVNAAAMRANAGAGTAATATAATAATAANAANGKANAGKNGYAANAE